MLSKIVKDIVYESQGMLYGRAEVEKIFFFLRVCYQSQIFSANFYKFCQGFSLKDSINTKENGIFFNFLLEFTIIFEF